MSIYTKCRLVGKGLPKKQIIDYQEIFSSIACFTSIRIILTLVVRMEQKLHQIDVKIAFVNCEINEQIYMV